MAKEDKKGKADKGEKGGKAAKKAPKAASSFEVLTKETYPVTQMGNVEDNGDSIKIDYRKPRSSARLQMTLAKTDLYAWAEGDEDKGYIVTDHPNFAAPIFADTINDIALDGGFWTGTDANGNAVGINASKVQVQATALAAE